MGDDFSFDVQRVLAFLFLGEGIVQRNTEGTAPFLNTCFPEKVVQKSDGLKCSEQTFVLLEIYNEASDAMSTVFFLLREILGSFFTLHMCCYASILNTHCYMETVFYSNSLAHQRLLPHVSYLAEVGGLTCLSDPESYASGSLGSW